MQSEKPYTVIGYKFNASTRDWTDRIVYHARDLLEAQNYAKCHRDWLKAISIEEGTIA